MQPISIFFINKRIPDYNYLWFLKWLNYKVGMTGRIKKYNGSGMVWNKLKERWCFYSEKPVLCALFVVHMCFVKFVVVIT